MNSRNPTQRHVSVIAVTIAALLGAAPAFAAAFELPYPPEELLLYGSIALLVVGIALRMFTRGNDAAPAPLGHDLRWWRNVEGI